MPAIPVPMNPDCNHFTSARDDRFRGALAEHPLVHEVVDEARDHADAADDGPPAPGRQSAEGAHRVPLRGAAHGELGDDHRHPDLLEAFQGYKCTDCKAG